MFLTGSSGLLGSKISEIAVKRGYKLFAGYYKHKTIYGLPVKLDIRRKTNVFKVFKDIKPDVVIHAAAITDVDKCEKQKYLAFSVNVLGTKNVVEASNKYDTFIIYISTDYVFSGETGMYKETDETNPVNYYGATKLRGENEVKKLKDNWCIIRPSVIYGSNPARGKHNFALLVLNKLNKRERIRTITDQWVSPTLNTNLTEMILETIERKFSGVYHTAGATPLNRYEFSKLLAEKFKLDKNLITPVLSTNMKWFAKRPKNTSLNVEKALKTLKNKPLKIREALNKLRKEIQTSRAREKVI